jgi:carboxymethylenebutenolidase
MGSWTDITARDGHRFKAYRAEPSGAVHGALVVAPEIFGVNSHIRSVADGFAADGYLALAPALFDRAQRDYDTGYAQADIQAGIAVMNSLNWDNTLLDVQAAIDSLRSKAKVGIVGYCWGGTVAWLAAARSDGLACAVAYYGGGIPSFAAETPRVPIMLNFGEQDQSPTLEQARQIAQAHPSAIAHFYPAGHGFNCDQRGSYHAQSAALARQRTLAFFVEHLG